MEGAQMATALMILKKKKEGLGNMGKVKSKRSRIREECTRIRLIRS
jgi:hypothetical protein